MDVLLSINKIYPSEAVCLLLWNPFVTPKHNLFVIRFSGNWSVVTECSNQAESSGLFFISFIFVCGHLFYLHQDFCPWTYCLHLQGKRLPFYLEERGTFSKVVRKCCAVYDLRGRFETLRRMNLPSPFFREGGYSLSPRILPRVPHLLVLEVSAYISPLKNKISLNCLVSFKY